MTIVDPSFVKKTSCSPEAYIPECRALNVLLEKGRTCRNLGSACLQLAWVASGRLDAYYELDLNSWDLAAGSLLVVEAGGKVSDTMGEEYTLLVSGSKI
jgi:myo-inositol-1(or 4)-monophosphatase